MLKNGVNNVMNKEEEQLLLGVLLYDISLNWGVEILSRLNKAKLLAEKHEFILLGEKITKEIKKETENSQNDFDGRCFEGNFESFLTSSTIKDKSVLFKKLVKELCASPELIFEDWE
ncbi:hypothetical protein [Bacillus subtilis]|uniref:hypothetical protein n=1 Tax=Bacillus subtilis TaxID=1423 RepID=UPI000849F661|nr:hypothetical protein [Bacillus subtilis]ODV47974.1 hypothetical protein BCM26_06085 [Bacillus subtilis]OJH63572.1 hypothetical protein BOH71_10030 [Bacillus subtilis]